jgi:dienelactone hydrolase
MVTSDQLDDSDVCDVHPSHPNGTAVLLLAGSSGRVERERAALLAAQGIRVRAIRWFGGAGQRPAPHEVPIELFLTHLDELRTESDRLAIFGTSFGAEAALVTASVTRLDATIAVAPSSVVWTGFADGGWSSHWTIGGAPLPAVAFDPSWSPTTQPPEYVGLYTASFERDPALTAAAAIRVEDIAGELLLVAGGDDRVWPSTRFADNIVQRRADHGLPTSVVTHPSAGHRLLLPGESAPAGGVRMARGGSAATDAELGVRAEAEIARLLGVRRP